MEKTTTTSMSLKCRISKNPPSPVGAVYHFGLPSFCFFLSLLSYLDAAMPMTPPATRGPLFPLVRESSWPPRPRSSSPAVTTRLRPMTLCGPISFTSRSSRCTCACPSSSTSTLPRSPTILSSSSGAPWFLPKGLNMPPALVRPCEKSPKTCMWMPCLPGVRPVMTPSMIVGASSCACERTKCPPTPSSPVITHIERAISAQEPF
mmetsp:Transcript_20519/g.31048  ORF Transcript_20519/g.31048 Transcript_20519/m.31048 type:complete len:205 (-) Transcript_20519:8-622(-)